LLLCAKLLLIAVQGHFILAISADPRYSLDRKRRRTELPSKNPADDEPPGEAEKLLKIKTFCTMATGSAEQIAGMSEEELLQDEDEFSINRYEIERYRKLLSEAINLARELTDEFYRNVAIHFLIRPLVAAGNEAQARKLFLALKVDAIQNAVLKEFPRLGAKF
jgi:hypothetical protein